MAKKIQELILKLKNLDRNQKVVLIFGVIVLLLGVASTQQANNVIRRETDFNVTPDKVVQREAAFGVDGSTQDPNDISKPIEDIERTVYENTDDYTIAIFNDGDLIHVTINSSPFEEKRREAEEALLEVLGQSRERICQLNVQINTPRFVNPAEAGKNYPVSYCDGEFRFDNPEDYYDFIQQQNTQ